MNKKAVDKALTKIIEDGGKDKGVNVERLKQVILDRIRYGDPKAGLPPDLYALDELGASKKVMKEALIDYNDITQQEVSLEEAISQASPSSLHDPTQPYYDDNGNLVLPSRYANLKDVPEDAAKKAFEARAQQKGIQVPAEEPQVTPDFMAADQPAGAQLQDAAARHQAGEGHPPGAAPGLTRPNSFLPTVSLLAPVVM